MSELKNYTLLQLEAMIDIIKDEFNYYEGPLHKDVSIKADLKADCYSITISTMVMSHKGVRGQGPDDTEDDYQEIKQQIKLDRLFKSSTLRDQLLDELTEANNRAHDWKI